MKHLYLFIAALIFSFCGFAKDAAPEALYLIGNFYGLEATGNGSLYKLTDKDGNGIYTGEFNIRAGNIRLRVVADDDPKSPSNVWGLTYTEYDSDVIYSDFALNHRLDRGQGFRYESQIEVNNWIGGRLIVEAAFNYMGILELTLKGPDQPKAPKAADNLYIIGDFNNWQKPGLSDNNGALPIALSYADDSAEGENYMGPSYSFDSTIPQSYSKDAAVAFCYFENGEIRYLKPETDRVTLWRDTNSKVYFSTSDIWSEANILNLENWDGGQIRITADFMNNAPVICLNPHDGKDPESLDSNTVYCVYTVDDNAPDIRELHSMYNDDIYGKNVSFFITTENNINPPADKRWGSAAKINPEFPSLNKTFKGNLVQGGEPFTFTDENEISVCPTVNKQDMSYSLSCRKLDYPEFIYIVGMHNNWGFDYKTKLSYQGNELYSGTFATERYDRFEMMILLGDDDYSRQLYPKQPLYENEFNFDDKYYAEGFIYAPGYSIWAFENWHKGARSIDVDFKYSVLHISPCDESGVESVISDEAEREYYNIHGMRVDNPTKGIYIVREGNVSKKIIIR